MDPLIDTFIRIGLAALLGGLIGLERVAAGKRAGSRTFALAAMGACLFVLVGMGAGSLYLGVVNFDPLRILASIIQGIGFIGAGLIILRDNSLHGLTTAAGLWVAAGVGAATGFGFYAIAAFTTFVTLLIFTIMWRFEEWVRQRFAPLAIVDEHGPLDVPTHTGD